MVQTSRVTNWSTPAFVGSFFNITMESTIITKVKKQFAMYFVPITQPITQPIKYYSLLLLTNLKMNHVGIQKKKKTLTRNFLVFATKLIRRQNLLFADYLTENTTLCTKRG